MIPEVYTDSDMPVNCKVAAGRDESDFYEALGIVGEGPLVAYSTPHYEDLDLDGIAETFVGSALDGQAHHGYPTNDYGLRQYLGTDPAAATDFFSLDQSGNQTGSDWREAFSGNSTYKDNFAAGIAFIVIRRSDAKGLQLSKPGAHAMVASVNQGMRGWTWDAQHSRFYGPALTNPVWIAANMLLRARGLRLGYGATTQQLDFAETLFDADAAVAAAAICDQQVTALVGTGNEAQFKFRGVLQEEKPFRDWLQEVLMNCLGYYTFANGKLKLGVRGNSSTVEAFTIGNIVFNSLQLAPLKPTFNHLTANFADKDYRYVNNSVAVYDIDHAALIGGAAGPLFLKSTVNLSGTSTKSQAARIISIRLREELGCTSPAEWKAARQLSFRTTVLALNTQPGMVCSMTHPDMPRGSGEFRVTAWRLNKDYSIDIQGRTTADSMYDLIAGPKPADVVASPVPQEVLIDTGVPGLVTATPMLTDYGSFALDSIDVQPDVSGNVNIVSAEEVALSLYYVDELTTDLWAMFDGDVDAATDPLTVTCTLNPGTARTFRVGDLVIINDEAADAANTGRRSYECAEIVGPGNVGDVVLTGTFQFQRAYAGMPVGQATFGTLRCAHQAGVKFYKLDMKNFTYSVKKGFFRTPGLPARIEAKLPSACIVAAVVSVANHFGYGPYSVFPLSHHNEPLMPGERTCSGGAYSFQVPGALVAQDGVPIPMRVHDPASIRSIFGYVQTGTSDGSCGLTVKYSRDGGNTWEVLEKMGIAQNAGAPYKTTYDHLVADGFGPPQSRRLPYRDYGLVTTQPLTASPAPQVVHTASHDATTTGLVEYDFVFFDFGGADEEYAYIQGLNSASQTFTAVVTKDHPAGTALRPAVWPTPVLREGYDLSFDIKEVASPNPGSDLTVVVQT